MNSRELITQAGVLSGLKADAALTQYYLVGEGSDADHIAYITDADTRPDGIVIEGCDAAEDYCDIYLMGGENTRLVKTSGAGSKGDLVCPMVDGSGKVRAVPDTDGHYFAFGRALHDWADGDVIAVKTFEPKLVGPVDADTQQPSLPGYDGDPATPVDGLLWHDYTNGLIRSAVGGAAVTIAHLLLVLAFVLGGLCLVQPAMATDKAISVWDDATVGDLGTLSASDAVTIGGDVKVNTDDFIVDIDGDITLAPTGGDVIITGTASVSSTLEVTGAATFTGGMANGGTVTTIDIDGGTIDGAVIGGASAAAITGTTITGTTITDGTVSFSGGTVTGTFADLGAVTTVDINGGTVDGAVIGGASAAAITGTTITGTTITDGTVSLSGGTVTGTFADLGAVTTVDINGGTVDGAVIGGASAAAITGTTITGTTITDGTISVTAGAVTGALDISGATVTYRAIAAADLAAALQDQVAYLTVTGADLAAAGTGTITIQLKDAAGNDLAARALVRTWIGTADDYGADALTDYSVSTGTSKEEVTANAEYLAITDASGTIVMAVDNGGAGTVYAWAEIAGRIVASGAVVLTAP